LHGFYYESRFSSTVNFGRTLFFRRGAAVALLFWTPFAFAFEAASSHACASHDYSMVIGAFRFAPSLIHSDEACAAFAASHVMDVFTSFRM
jgi:hypothetical protein